MCSLVFSASAIVHGEHKPNHYVEKMHITSDNQEESTSESEAGPA